MKPEMTPETTVLVDYANENLQFKIENARLRQRVELEKDHGRRGTRTRRRVREEACRGYTVLPHHLRRTRRTRRSRTWLVLSNRRNSSERRTELREDIDREQQTTHGSRKLTAPWSRNDRNGSKPNHCCGELSVQRKWDTMKRHDNRRDREFPPRWSIALPSSSSSSDALCGPSGQSNYVPAGSRRREHQRQRPRRPGGRSVHGRISES